MFPLLTSLDHLGECGAQKHVVGAPNIHPKVLYVFVAHEAEINTRPFGNNLASTFLWDSSQDLDPSRVVADFYHDSLRTDHLECKTGSFPYVSCLCSVPECATRNGLTHLFAEKWHLPLLSRYSTIGDTLTMSPHLNRYNYDIFIIKCKYLE